jgi:hypothetical protein
VKLADPAGFSRTVGLSSFVPFQSASDQLKVETRIGLAESFHRPWQIKKPARGGLLKESNGADHRQPAMNRCNSSGPVINQERDLGQFTIRNQMAGVPGASVPPAFGGRYRQIMVYVDPLKLEAHGLSVMDMVRTVNDANLILPAGDVRIGPYDYNIYANSQINDTKDIDSVPLKTVGQSSVLVADVGEALDASQI